MDNPLVATRTILIDANLLLLLVIGTMIVELIPHFKRTSTFTRNDFHLLVSLAAQADRVMTTPHVLTEVSNLANSLREEQREEFAGHFRIIIGTLDEHYTPAVTLAQHEAFRLGIADISMLHAAGSTLILTEDARFASEVNSGGQSIALDLRTAAGLRGML